ncbi:hypothetical protein GDN83_18550 [Gordonia jinghuaiqii]|uniref:Uncharacterized protein n=1 Tax=Gordonia jinghuaiqii TaxID=2758710 RepID=A0A7D7LQK5_9ACTN|nr:hypothetical protein [Gordonia jinghuaiqii]MCR5979714.1 hypothetical protein [Gordonia jinghuaiqii]QMT00885.1 hypothetical protein H1R19_18730 [Gordonia jinghuaiqii]
MSDLIVDPAALITAAVAIEHSASRIGNLRLGTDGGPGYTTQPFASLTDAFRGATHDMSHLASSTDRRIATSLSNTSDAVSAFAALVMHCRNTTVHTDDDNSDRIADATGHPVRAGALTDHPVPQPILQDVAAKAPR